MGGVCQRNAVEPLCFQGNRAGPRIPSSASREAPGIRILTGAGSTKPYWSQQDAGGGGARTGPLMAWSPEHDMTGHSAQPVAGREQAPGSSGKPPAHSTTNYFP